LFKVLVQYFVGYFVILWGMFNTHDVSGVDSTSCLQVIMLCHFPIYSSVFVLFILF